MSAEAIAIVAVGVALLAALVPLLSMRGDMKTLRTEVRADLGDMRTEVRADLGDLRTGVRTDLDDLRTEVRADLGNLRGDVADARRDLQALGERVARMEGRLDALAPVRPMAAPADPPAPAA